MTLSPFERSEMIASSLAEVRVALDHLVGAPEHGELTERVQRLQRGFEQWEATPPSLLDGMGMTNDVLGLLLVVTRLRRKSSMRP